LFLHSILYFLILVVDYKPRIRNGLSLNSILNVQHYDISVSTVSCEVITDNFSVANGIQFYTINLNRSSLKSFNMFSSLSYISSNYYNLSVIFKLSAFNYELYTPNSNYMCCTTNKGISTGSCTQVYLEGNYFNTNTNTQPVDETIKFESTTSRPLITEPTETVLTTTFTVFNENVFNDHTEPKLLSDTQSYKMLSSTGTILSNYFLLFI
jgi:hypothetical protein